MIVNYLQPHEFKQLVREAVQEAISKNLELLKNPHPMSKAAPGGNGNPVDQTVLNVYQATDFLGIKRSKTYALVSEKKLPHHRKGKRIYFRRGELALIRDKVRRDVLSGKL